MSFHANSKCMNEYLFLFRNKATLLLLLLKHLICVFGIEMHNLAVYTVYKKYFKAVLDERHKQSHIYVVKYRIYIH